jgi:hypothetical protein
VSDGWESHSLGASSGDSHRASGDNHRATPRHEVALPRPALQLQHLLPHLQAVLRLLKLLRSEQLLLLLGARGEPLGAEGSVRLTTTSTRSAAAAPAPACAMEAINGSAASAAAALVRACACCGIGLIRGRCTPSNAASSGGSNPSTGPVCAAAGLVGGSVPAAITAHPAGAGRV